MEARPAGPPTNDALYRGLFENNHAVMLLIDPANGAILDANPAACAYYGWSRAELKSLTIHAINTLSPAEIAGQLALAAEKRRSAFCFRHRRADGSVRDVEVHSGPVELDGRALLFSIVHDVTDRNEIQASLAESERRLSILMANLPGMAYRCLNDERWTMLFVSGGCLELTGHPAHELLENRRVSYNDLIHPDDREAVWDQVQASLARRAPFHLTYRIRTAAGEEKWVMERGQGVFAPDGGLIALEGFISDITRLKRAEEAMRESEEKFRLAFHTSPDAVNLNRMADGIYLDINAGFTELTGFTREDAIGRSSLDISIWENPRDRARLVAALREKGLVENFEAPFRRKNGTVGIGLMSARVLRIGGEELILSVTRDITERKRVEEALRESEDRYRQIVEAATAGILMHDRERIIYANPAALRMLGAGRPEDLVGRRYLDLVHPEDRAESAARLEKSSDPAWIAPPREHRLVGTDGRVIHVESTGVPIQLRGKLRHLAIFIDITDRKRIEASLRESEEKYRELAESLPQGIFEIDSQGRLTYFNRTGCSLFGYSPEEVPPDFNVLKAIAPEDRERAAADIMRNAAAQDSSRNEYTAIRKDGTRIHVGIHATRIVRGDAFVGLRGILMDLTPARRAEEEKRRLEAQLQQAQKMEAIGVLAGGIAHDFNNILAAIIGYIELARLSGPGQQSLGELTQALAAAQRARDLVKQILAFSRQSDDERMPVRVAMVVKEAVRFLRATIPATVEIHSRFEDPHATVMAGSVALHQIMMNLCTNAVHALGGRSGRLEIEVAQAEALPGGPDGGPGLSAGPYVRISVADNGCGMEPEVIERIFDPYFTTKEKGLGTGLGLAVVHGIVAKYGGAVRVESTPGRGSVFHVYLPRVELAPPPMIETPGPAAGGRGRILFVDDEKMLAEIAEQALTRLGYEVETRTGPLEALELFRAKPRHFDLVITDQTMPGMTGEALAAELVRLRPGIPILLCTGYSQTLNPKQLLPRGIRALIMKPILINELDAAIRKALAE